MPAGRHLYGDGKPEGRVRRLSGRGRNQPAVSLQDPADGLRVPAGDRRDGEAAHAGRCGGDHRLDRHRVRRDRQVDAWRKTSATDRRSSSSPRASPSTRRARPRSRRSIAKYPPGKQASAVHPAALHRAGQMERQTGSAWVPRVGDGRGRRAARDGADPRLRGRDVLLHVQHAADRASATCRSARRRRAGCAARTR